jgi:phosphomannomutase
MNKHTLEAAAAARAKELKTQKTAKAKRIVVGSDVHQNSYQAARKVDSGVVSAVADFRSQTELK